MTARTEFTATEGNLDQIGVLFDTIAAKAGEIDRLCYFGIEGEEQLELRLEIVRDLVSQMGWMADLGSTKLGRFSTGPLRGGPEGWLLPPMYQKLGGGAKLVEVSP